MNIKWIGCSANNYSVGRADTAIRKIVLHWIVGDLDAADAVFNDGRRRVSAHYGVGETEIHQYVKEQDTAYHAGDWDVNTESIGIEHRGGPNLPITEPVYKQSIELIADICKRYNIPVNRDYIKCHREIVPTQCPGTLDVDRIINEVNSLLTRPQEITDQTKINVGGEFGIMEVQAIRSKLNDLTGDTKTAIDERLKAEVKLNGFVHKWVEEYKLPTDAGLVQVEQEMAKLLPLEDDYQNTIITIEEVVGHFQDKNARLQALRAVKDDIKAVSDKLDECQKKLSTRKILYTFTVAGYTFKVYKEN